MKKLFAIILAITMMTSLAVPAFAVEATTQYGLWVGGVQVTSANCGNITAEIGGTASGEATYDHGTHTLTLDNFSYEGIGHSGDYGLNGAAIYCDYTIDSLNIVLKGTNTLTGKADSYGNGGLGIYFEKSNATLYISDYEEDDSTGVLSINSDYYGIDLELSSNTSTLEIEDVTLNVNSKNYGIANVRQLSITNSTVEIQASGNNRAFTSQLERISFPNGAENYSVYTSRDSESPVSPEDNTYTSKYFYNYLRIEPMSYTITKEVTGHGNFNVPAKVAAGASVIINPIPDAGYSVASVTCTSAGGTPIQTTENNGEYSFTMPAENVTVAVEFSEFYEEYPLWVGGVQVTSHNCEDITTAITGVGVTASGVVTYDHENRTLTLNNFVFSGNAEYNNEVIYAEDIDLTIKLVGESNITSFSENYEVIRIGERQHSEELNTIIVDGDETNEGADLTIYSEYNDGIQADNLIIDGCHIDVEAPDVEKYGIAAYCDMTIRNSVINANAAFCGLSAGNNMEITNSEITANGSCAGVIVGLFNYFGAPSRVTITNSTITAFGGAEGLIMHCDTFDVVNSLVTATSNGVGIDFNEETVVNLNGAAVYLSNATPSQPVSNPTNLDFESTYVKIISATFPKNESTTVTFNVDPAYTITIPATVELEKTEGNGTVTYENDYTITAEAGVRLHKGDTIVVTVSSDYEMTAQQGATLDYTITHKNGDALTDSIVATFTTNTEGQSSTIHIAANDPEFAGDYSDTVTFTISVKKPTISFTINGVTYQAEEGMNWAAWVNSAYNNGGFRGDINAIIKDGLFVSAGGALVCNSDSITANAAYDLISLEN